MLRIEWIWESVANGRYYFSHHGDEERQSDNLTLAEVEQALLAGRILEQY